MLEPSLHRQRHTVLDISVELDFLVFVVHLQYSVAEGIVFSSCLCVRLSARPER